MHVLRWFIAQVSLLAIVLGVSLSGLGMAHAHTTMMLETSNSVLCPQTVDHSDHLEHSAPNHADHDSVAISDAHLHEGHASCPMVACCHTGGADTPLLGSMGEPVAFQYLSPAELHLAKAEPAKAKKPPKHV